MGDLDLTTVPVHLPNGATVYVRAHDQGGAQSIAERDGADFGPVQRSIEGISTAVLDALRAAMPDEVTVEFGINVAARSGKLTGLLVSADASASLRVSMLWRRGEHPPRTGASEGHVSG